MTPNNKMIEHSYLLKMVDSSSPNVTIRQLDFIWAFILSGVKERVILILNKEYIYKKDQKWTILINYVDDAFYVSIMKRLY